MALTKDEILALDDVKVLPVKVPEWNRTVYVRSMSGTERDQYEAMLIKATEKPVEERVSDARSFLVMLCMCTESGERLFEPGDMGAINLKNGAALTRVASAATKHNALTAKDIEDEAGN